MLRALALLVVMSAAMVACRGGGAQSDSGASPTVSDEAFRWSAQLAVNAVLLTEDDLPASFTLGADDGTDAEEDEFDELTLTGECAEFNEYLNVEGNWLHSVAEAETGDFQDDDGDGFSANAAAFRTLGDAELETNLMARFFGSCIDQFQAAFMAYLDEALQQVAVDEGAELSDLAVDISELAVPSHGDWTLGIRFDMTFAVDGIPLRVVSDSVSVRVGRMVGTVEATVRGELEASLEDQRDSLVALVAAKLAEEDSKLPS